MDSITAIGTVRVIQRKIDTGEIVFDKTYKNQITNYARSQAAALWSGLVVPVPSKISLGTGTGTTSQNDTALWNEISGSRKQIDYATVWLTYNAQYSVTYMNNEVLGTGTNQSVTITEAGLWDANGNLWSHVPLSGCTHDNTTTLSIQWQILQNGN